MTAAEAFEAKYQRSAQDPSSAEMLTVFTDGWIAALEVAYGAMFDIKGDKATRFDAQTAIRKIKDAAAIRAREDGVAG